jgi:hypothetical protein
LQSKNKALSKRGNTGKGTPKGKQQPKGARGRNSNNNKKGKGGQNDNDYMNALGKWAWLKVPPKQGETKKMFEGKEFLWCKNHLRWGRHLTAKCKKAPPTKKNQTTSSPNTSSNANNRTLTIAESLQAIAEEEEED